MSEQLDLPGIPASPPRVKTRHRFGAPHGDYALAACRSCPVQRRWGPFGKQGGYQMQWSRDGQTWSDAEIPCVLKKRG